MKKKEQKHELDAAQLHVFGKKKKSEIVLEAETFYFLKLYLINKVPLLLTFHHLAAMAELRRLCLPYMGGPHLDVQGFSMRSP